MLGERGTCGTGSQAEVFQCERLSRYHVTMITEAALLKTIRESPDDDTARLVYADFIEEEGDPARAEFIRVQIALSHTEETAPERRALEDREHELLAEHESRWLGVPPDSEGLERWQFARGFVDEVSATPLFMLNEGSDLCAANPLRRWRVETSDQNTREHLIEAGQRGWFSRLESLDLFAWFKPIGEMEHFFIHSNFERLRELDLQMLPGLDVLPAILQRSPLCEQLKVLRVGGMFHGETSHLDAADLTRALARTRLTTLSVPITQLTAQDIRGLLIADCCKELTSLDIRGNHIEPDGWDAFRPAKCRLRELDLSSTPLGAISLENVLRQPSLSELRSLNLNRCGSAMANMRALASSRFWTQAEALRMADGTIPARALEPLFAADGPPALRTLDMHTNFFRAEGVAGLCRAKWSGSLTSLNLSQNYLTDDSLRMLAASGRFRELRTLDVCYNNRHQDGAVPGDWITAAGFDALFGGRGFENLRSVTMGGTEFNAANVDALMNGSRRRVRELDLASYEFPPGVIELLASSPSTTWLKRFRPSSFVGELAGNGLMPLAESEYLSPLCELHIDHSGVDAETRAALRARLGRRLIG